MSFFFFKQKTAYEMNAACMKARAQLWAVGLRGASRDGRPLDRSLESVGVILATTEPRGWSVLGWLWRSFGTALAAASMVTRRVLCQKYQTAALRYGRHRSPISISSFTAGRARIP